MAEEDDILGPPGPGHNSTNAVGARLNEYVEKIEDIEREIGEFQEDRKEVYAEAKIKGYESKIVRRIITFRRKVESEIAAEHRQIGEYMAAIGMGYVEWKTNSEVEDADLLAIFQRIERIEADIKGLQEDRSEILKEAKSQGWDTRTIRRVISYKKADKEALAEQEAIFELYLTTLGLA